MRSFVPILLAAAWITGAAMAAAPSPASVPAVAAAAAPAADTARVHIGPAKGGTDMFVAWPDARRPAPAVVVVHEWWGLNEQIRETARRLARQGYVAVVPDLYHGKVAGDAEGAHELMRGLDEERGVADLEAAIAWLREEPRVGRAPIGVVGFCMGGRFGQLLALDSDQVAATVMFCGRPVLDPEALEKLRAPLQGHFGAEDQGIPVERVKELEAALEKAGRKAEIYTYAGAGHAFMHDGRASYHADAARQAWARTLAFLQKHLKK